MVGSHLQVEARAEQGANVLVLAGELDVASSGALEAALARLDESRPVIIDLQALTFVDSTGLGVLVHSHQRLQDAGGRLVLIKGGGQVERLLEITGVAGHLRVVSSLDRALAPEA